MDEFTRLGEVAEPHSVGSREQVVDRVRCYYTRVDDEDVDGILELFAPSAVYRRPGYDPLVGHDALRDFYLNQRVIRKGHHNITHVLHEGSDVVVRGTFLGTLRDGSMAQLEFADFFRTAKGLFVERTTYFFAPLV